MKSGKSFQNLSYIALIEMFIMTLGIFEILNIFHLSLLYKLAIYFAITIISRHTFAYYHLQGIHLVNQGKYEESIKLFNKSYDFHNKNKWIYFLRGFLLFSTGNISHKEFSLLNIAFAYTQIGNKEKASFWYKRTLHEFPNSSHASAAIKMIETFENQAPSPIPGSTQ